MDIPHRPYWRQNSLGATQVWYTGLPDCPFDVPDMGEKDKETVRELKRVAQKYGTGQAGGDVEERKEQQ